MKIKKIKVSNFKSFKDLDLELGNFNVIVGANASGKSNFIQIFRFIRDIEQNDLRNALSMNGSLASLCNIQKDGEKLRIHLEFDNKGIIETAKMRFHDLQTSITFSLMSNSSSKGFTICENEFSKTLNLTPARTEKGLWENDPINNKVTISFNVKDGKPNVQITPPEMKEQIEAFVPISPSVFLSRIPAKVEDLLFFLEPFPIFPMRESFRNIGIYDFDPRSAKNPVKIAGKADLEEDGKNLALILSHILENEEKKRMLNNLLNSLLPFVVAAGTEKFAEKSLMVTLQEKFYNRELRADLLSDGTLDVIALLVTLYFEKKNVVFLEEPERNLHPHLISGLVEMMKEVSKKKQLFITTHSPELIKHAGIENLLLISRNKEGNSVVTRPRDSRQLKVFLENELGLDDLFVQNLLDLQ